VDEVLEVGRVLDTHPEAGRLLASRTGGMPVRQFPLKSFPYVLVYLPEERPVLILSVAHTSRMPRYWPDRLRGEDDRDR
jgi:plasmid stabilization system protein ParE